MKDSRGETRFNILYMDNFGRRYDAVYLLKEACFKIYQV